MDSENASTAAPVTGAATDTAARPMVAPGASGRAAASTPTAWGAMAVSGVVLAVWAYATIARLPLGDGQVQLLNAALTLTLGYWLGSSSGSAAKSSTIERLSHGG